MKSSSPGMRIVWGDIESTGLNEFEDVILEVGLRVTNWWGDELQRITVPVWNANWKTLLNRDTDAAKYVKNMHVNSGLVDRLVALEMEAGDDIRRVKFLPVNMQEVLMDWLAQHVREPGPIDGKYAFAGNSIAMDRRFLERYMPNLNNWFHYRNLDMSAIREAMRYVNPALHERLPDLQAEHRPQGDIDNSIAFWRFYIDNFFHEV